MNFLQFNEYNILNDAEKVSHDVTLKLAEKECSKFRIIQDCNFESDFDKEVKNITDKPQKKRKYIQQHLAALLEFSSFCLCLHFFVAHLLHSLLKLLIFRASGIFVSGNTL